MVRTTLVMVLLALFIAGYAVVGQRMAPWAAAPAPEKARVDSGRTHGLTPIEQRLGQSVATAASPESRSASGHGPVTGGTNDVPGATVRQAPQAIATPSWQAPDAELDAKPGRVDRAGITPSLQAHAGGAATGAGSNGRPWGAPMWTGGSAGGFSGAGGGGAAAVGGAAVGNGNSRVTAMGERAASESPADEPAATTPSAKEQGGPSNVGGPNGPGNGNTNGGNGGNGGNEGSNDGGPGPASPKDTQLPSTPVNNSGNPPAKGGNGGDDTPAPGGPSTPASGGPSAGAPAAHVDPPQGGPKEPPSSPDQGAQNPQPNKSAASRLVSDVRQVPEPAFMTLAGLGLGMAVFRRLRSRRG